MLAATKREAAGLGSSLDRVIEGESSEEKFISFLSLEKYKNQRVELVAEMGSNPLLRWRLFEFHKVLRTNQDLKKDYKRHRQLVEWQLSRIYRSRNNLVHSGEIRPHYIRMAMNLDEYYKGLINCLLEELRAFDGIKTIDQILIDVQLHESLMTEHYLTKDLDPNDNLRPSRILNWNPHLTPSPAASSK